MTIIVGNATNDNDFWYNGADTTVLSQFTAPANVTINRGFIKNYDYFSSTEKSKILIYSDNGSDLPNILLGASDEKTGWGDNGMNTWDNPYTFSTPVALSNGVIYWIGAFTDVALRYRAYAVGGARMYYSAAGGTPYATGPLTPMSGGSIAHASQFCIYVDDGGAAPPASGTIPPLFIIT